MLAPTSLLDAATGALARDAVAVPIAVPAAHIATVLWAMARHDYRPHRQLARSLAPALERDISMLRPVWENAYGREGGRGRGRGGGGGGGGGGEGDVGERVRYFDFGRISDTQALAAWEDEKEKEEFSFAAAFSARAAAADGTPAAAAHDDDSSFDEIFDFAKKEAMDWWGDERKETAEARRRKNDGDEDEEYDFASLAAGHSQRKKQNNDDDGTKTTGTMLDPWDPATPRELARILRAYAEMDLGVGAPLDHLAYLFGEVREFLPTLDAAHTAMLGYALASMPKNPVRTDASFHADFARHVRDNMDTTWASNDGNEEDDDDDDDIDDVVEGRTKRGCSPNDLAMLARLYGILRQGVPELLSMFKEEVCGGEAGGGGVSGAGGGGGGGGLIGDVCHQLRLRGTQIAADFSNEDLATFAWSLAATGHDKDEAWTSALVEEMRNRGPGMTRAEMRPEHLSRILWSCASASAGEQRRRSKRTTTEVADVILVNAIRSTVRNKEYTASDAATVLWCVATVKKNKMGATHDSDDGDGGGGDWGELEEEKNKWIRKATSALYERAAELTLDEREATHWALTQLATGSKTRRGYRGSAFETDYTEALEDGVSSPKKEAKFMIDARGRLARIA